LVGVYVFVFVAFLLFVFFAEKNEGNAAFFICVFFVSAASIPPEAVSFSFPYCPKVGTDVPRPFLPL